ncbi:MAG: hypothetical protein LBM98_04430 [Oscillospiraceae bacterium]|nr:hypothetical protein [Oscillospiraceae bacterium]
MRSNPVPGGQHTVRIAGLYVNPGLLRRISRYVSQVRWRLRKDGQGAALPPRRARRGRV